MSLLSINDITPEGIASLIRETDRIKKNPKDYSRRLEGKIMLLLFEKPSTRTRISFETAMLQLGGNAIDLNESMMQLGRGETIDDSAKVLSRYADCIVARVREHRTLEELSMNASIPVINGLSDIEHPCQAIADLYTMYEIKGRLSGINLAYIGDGNNVCNSLMLASAMTGINIAIAAPKGYEPPREFIEKAESYAKASGSAIGIMNDAKKAARDADFLYTDVWVSMGFESEEKDRMNAFSGYQINQGILDLAKPSCRVMHCLPAHRGLEITDEVLDSEAAVVWDQAENRMHAQKAILLKELG